MSTDGTPNGDDQADILASLGDPARFAAVFERHVVGIYRYHARRVGSNDAEDLTAETFADAFRHRARYQPDRGSARAWLFGIATNLLLHHHRGESRRLAAHGRIVPVMVSESAENRLVDRLYSAARLDAALRAIGPELRDVVMLIAVAELTYDETAAALDIPIGTVRSRLWRARRELREALDPSEGSWILPLSSATEGCCDD